MNIGETRVEILKGGWRAQSTSVKDDCYTPGKQDKVFSVLLLLGQLLPVCNECVVMKRKKKKQK